MKKDNNKTQNGGDLTSDSTTKKNTKESKIGVKNVLGLNPNAIFNGSNSNKSKKTPKPLPPPTYKLNYYKYAIGVFSKVYKRSDIKWRVFIVIIVGILMSLTSLFLIQNTGVYISGLSGIFQGIARIVKIILKKNDVSQQTVELVYQILFYVLYLFTNIPLIIFSWKKMGKRFTILSSIVVICSNIVPLVLNQIPGINHIFLFGRTRVNWVMNGTQDISTDLFLLNFSSQQIIYAFPMFIYALAAAAINGFAYAMAVAVGGSSGGLDFLSFFFAYKKGKPIGKILMIFNISSIFISSMMGSFIAGGIANATLLDAQNNIVGSSGFAFENFLSQNLISGVLYGVISIQVLNALFPKDRVVKIQVYCEDVLAVRNYLYSTNFNHSLTINTSTGGYSLQPKQNFEIICLFIEIPRILRQLKEAKQNMLITVTPLKGIDGKLSVEEALN